MGKLFSRKRDYAVVLGIIAGVIFFVFGLPHLENVWETVAVIVSFVTLYFSFIQPFLSRPKLYVKVEPLPAKSDQDFYLRLLVKNEGGRIARRCVGRLIDIRKSGKEPIAEMPQLNFLWERQNQINTDRTVDIWSNGYIKYLDIATFNENGELYFRLDTENQPIAPADESNWEMCLIKLKSEHQSKKYYVRIGIYADNDVFVEPTWYTILKKDAQSFSLEKTPQDDCPID